METDKVAKSWENAKIVNGYDPSNCRKDPCGAWIEKDEYGKESSYGWTIDHVLPVSKGGTDHDSNIRAMHWRNNRKKADSFIHYTSEVTSDGTKNVEREIFIREDDELIYALDRIYPNHPDIDSYIEQRETDYSIWAGKDFVD